MANVFPKRSKNDCRSMWMLYFYLCIMLVIIYQQHHSNAPVSIIYTSHTGMGSKSRDASFLPKVKQDCNNLAKKIF